MIDIELFNDHFQNFKAYGFEIKKDFCAEARVKVLTRISKSLFV